MINPEAVPVHIGIIMDGNGRWAKNKGLSRTSGHKEGLSTVKNIVRTASEIGVKYLTLYTFSTENWKRTQEEVGFLMNLIRVHLRAEFQFYKENKIRIKHLGNLSGLPDDIQKEIINIQNDTKDFSGLTVVLAINYGGRDEIVRGIKKIISNNPDVSDITEETVRKSFDIEDLPDVDLLIRTGGELRLSNFLLWHAAYAEFVFTNTLWPDYNKEEFFADIEDYQKRSRRFGGLKSN